MPLGPTEIDEADMALDGSLSLLKTTILSPRTAIRIGDLNNDVEISKMGAVRSFDEAESKFGSVKKESCG